MTVIGGGVIGLSIAWRLSQKGVRVVVEDAGNLGGEASSAGAGMLHPSGEFTSPSIWTELGSASYAMYPAFISELAADTGIAIDYQVCGAIEYGPSGEEHLSSDAAYVDPGDLNKALRAACLARGVEIRKGRLTLEVDAGSADALVIAAGAWSGRIAVTTHGRRLTLPAALPVKGHLVGYNMPPGSLGRIRRRGHTYVLQRASGFTVAGSNEERIGFDSSVNRDTCDHIHAEAAQLWPELASRAPDKCWIGFRPATEDLLPQIGRVDDTNVWLAYGHYRNGFLLAPVTADRISKSIESAASRTKIGSGSISMSNSEKD